jgi:cytochrome c oxidase assembly protein subunit 15
MAVGTYSLLVWTGLNVLSHPIDAYPAIVKEGSAAVASAASAAQKSTLSMLQQYAKSLTPAAVQHAQRTRVGVLSTVALTGCTILSGAFVAGNDAGNAYNEFPLMNGKLIPWDEMVNDELVPKWRNMFETTATVQWNHRMLGTCTALGALSVAGYGLLHPAGRAVAAKSLSGMTPQAEKGLLALGTAAMAQMSLGIATLLHYVPISLAACHQLGSLVVLTTGIYSAHSLRYASSSVLSTVRDKGLASLTEKGVSSVGGGSGGIRKTGVVVVSKIASKII